MITVSTTDGVPDIADSLGINADEVALRKVYLELGEQDGLLLRELHARLGGVEPAFIEAFYSHLLSFEQTRALLPDEAIIDRLRHAQQQYFDQLLSGQYDRAYVLERLKVGLVHQQVGLEPKWYLGAYNKYLSEMMSRIGELYAADAGKALDTLRALMKAVFFDIGFVLDTYFYADQQSLIKLKQYAEQIVTCMPTGLAVLDADLKLLSANAAFRMMFGLGDMDPKATPLDTYLDIPDIEQRIAAMRETGQHQHDIAVCKQTAEETRYFRTSLSPTTLNGAPAVLLMLEDLTRQAQLQQSLEASELRVRSILEHLVDGVVTIDEQGIVQSINPAAERIFGYRPGEVAGENVKILMPEPYRSEHDGYLKRYLETGKGRILGIGPREVKGRRKDGGIIPIDLATSEMRIGDQRTFIGVVRDISERKAMQETMRKLSNVVEQSAESVMITDQEALITYVNPAFESVTGYGAGEAIGLTPAILKSGKHGKEFYARLWETIRSGEAFSDVFINRRKNGTLYYEQKTITPLKDEAGRITSYVSSGLDISERMQVQEQFHYLTNYDALTELPNRRLLMERMNQALAHARWKQRTLCLLYLDVDRFKHINDTLGHASGDSLLKMISGRLVDAVRETDTVARLGGDEFGILLDDIASLDDVRLIADKILQCLARPYQLEGRELFITASAGISCYPHDGTDGHTLLKHADIAMYRGKEAGKNNYQFYSREMSARALQRLTLESNLRRALEKEEFVLHYQPQVDLKSGNIVAVEALLRWQNPDLGLVPPLEFIPLLEETGLIVPVGDWVMRAAFAQCRAWNTDGISPPRVSINLSARQLGDAGLGARVGGLLEEFGISGGHIEFEITESVVMNNAVESIDMLNDFRAMGVRLAVDDFGTGYSSLSYLKRLPIDTLKIDRSFVSDVDSDSDSAAIAVAILSLAAGLGLEVVAEGVETSEQLRFFHTRGCGYIQGYLFSRPVPAEDISGMLRDGKALSF